MSTEKVVIVGAGDHGRGTLEILLAARQRTGGPEVLGFLDDAPAKHGTRIGGFLVLGSLDWARTHHHSGIGYILGIAHTRVKQRLAACLDELACEYISAVHPSAVIGRGVTVSPGSIINAGVTVAYDTVIGRHTTLNLNATVGHDCVIERYVTVAPGANVAGRVTLHEGCDIGLNATVGKALCVGPWASVGPGSVVVRDVAPELHVFGNPARRVPVAKSLDDR